MDADTAQDPKLLAHYEGVIRTTASRSEPYVEEDFDDICQFYRYKVWKALLSFDPANLRVAPRSRKHCKELRDRYVFSCIKNAEKDVLKKKRHGHLFIEDVAPNVDHGVTGSGHTVPRSKFEDRYLKDEGAYDVIEQELPVVPSTLTESESAVLLLLYLNFKTIEIAERTELSRAEINAMVRSIREKMADWRPAGATIAAPQLEPEGGVADQTLSPTP